MTYKQTNTVYSHYDFEISLSYLHSCLLPPFLFCQTRTLFIVLIGVNVMYIKKVVISQGVAAGVLWQLIYIYIYLTSLGRMFCFVFFHPVFYFLFYLPIL